MKKKSVVVTALVLLLGGYLAVCLLARIYQERLVYFPGGPPQWDPASQLLEFEELRLTASDGVEISGWLILGPKGNDSFEPDGAVLVSHGNGGNIGNRLGLAMVFVRLGYAVLLYDYRGYGNSAGSPSEDGTYLDAEAAYEHLLAAGFAPERIVSYGESLGGAVAVELALRRPVAAVVVEDTFTSIDDIGAEAYPWLPVRWLSRIRYDTLSKVADLPCPLMVVHSPEDETVPYAHGERLFAAARDPKQMLTTSGGHNDGGFLLQPAWQARVQAFIDHAFEGRVESGSF